LHIGGEGEDAYAMIPEDLTERLLDRKDLKKALKIRGLEEKMKEERNSLVQYEKKWRPGPKRHAAKPNQPTRILQEVFQPLAC